MASWKPVFLRGGTGGTAASMRRGMCRFFCHGEARGLHTISAGRANARVKLKEERQKKSDSRSARERFHLVLARSILEESWENMGKLGAVLRRHGGAQRFPPRYADFVGGLGFLLGYGNPPTILTTYIVAFGFNGPTLPNESVGAKASVGYKSRRPFRATLN
jgi:hypothetical protein